MPNPVVYGLYQNYYVKPLLVDVNGSPIISGTYGNAVWNYANVMRFYWEDLNLVAGVNTHDFPALIARQLCFITAVWFRYSVTIAANHIRCSIWDGANDYPFIDQLGPVANTGYTFQTNIPFHIGENIRVTITAAAVGNDIFTSFQGYMMTVP